MIAFDVVQVAGRALYENRFSGRVFDKASTTAQGFYCAQARKLLAAVFGCDVADVQTFADAVLANRAVVPRCARCGVPYQPKGKSQFCSQRCAYDRRPSGKAATGCALTVEVLADALGDPCCPPHDAARRDRAVEVFGRLVAAGVGVA